MTKKNMECQLPKHMEELQQIEVEFARGYLETLTPEKRQSVLAAAKEKVAEEAMRPGLTVIELEDIEKWKQLIRKFDN